MKTKKIFTKEEILEISKKWKVVSYIRGYYQHLFEPKERFVMAQKLACKVILRSGLPKNSPIYKNAHETFSRMTK